LTPAEGKITLFDGDAGGIKAPVKRRRRQKSEANMPIGRKNLRERNEFLSSIFERFNGQIYGYVARMVDDRSEAEDILQEVFLRAARALKEGSEDRNRRWLFKVASNLAIDRLRRRRFKMASIDHFSQGASLERAFEGDSPMPDEVMSQSELRCALDGAVAALPVEQREVVLLRHFSGLSFSEISKVTGRPLGTVLSRMHRALEKLRKEMGGQYGWSDETGEGNRDA